MRFRVLFLSAFFLVPLAAAPAAQEEAPAPAADLFEFVGTVDHPPIAEMSGIVKSRTYEDVWWVHNDSGDDARIFAIDGKGEPVIPPYWEEGKPWEGLRLRAAWNIDWEDIAIRGDRILVAEMGNNGNARRDLGVYVVPEPNPRATTEMRALTFLPIAYPDQKEYPGADWSFDCEALFVADGKLWFLTKHRAGRIDRGALGTKLYRLDSERTNEVNVLTLVDSRDDMALPTAADVSPDGRTLAVLTVRRLWLFPRPEEGAKWLQTAPRTIDLPRGKTKQAEALTFDSATQIRITNENRDIYTVDLE